jgi:DNA-binding MarR family transcriptional regulator
MRDSVGYDSIIELLRTSNCLWRASTRFFRRFGISNAQFNILHELGDNQKGVSQRDLSDVLVVDRSNITQLIDQMEKKKWLERTDDPHDRRIYRIRLTPQGIKLWKSILPHYKVEVAKLTSNSTKADLNKFHKILNQIRQAAENFEK